MFVGEVGPMSRIRSPGSLLRYASRADHPLECRGMRGPVRTVGLKEGASSACVLLNGFRIAFVSLFRRPGGPVGESMGLLVAILWLRFGGDDPISVLRR